MMKQPFFPPLMLATVLGVLPLAAAKKSNEPVAIVYSLSGTASAVIDGNTRPATLFARFPAGAVVQTGAGAKLSVAFSNGNRYELGPLSRATLTATDCRSSSGTVRRLAPVPPLPAFASAPEDAAKVKGYAAVRVRGKQISGLYPWDGTATLADETVLRFSAPAGADYRVEIMDHSGRELFRVTTRSSEVGVPAGVLKPDSRYWWAVRGATPTGGAEEGVSEFMTLAEKATRTRAALKQSLLANGDAPSLALLAGIDEQLRLLWEAHEELRQALAKAPGDQSLREALDRVEREIPSDLP